MWSFCERLHHKLHDMLMFDIAELELDGRPYKGEAQNPKRDTKVAEKSSNAAQDPAAFKKLLDRFKTARRGGGSAALDRALVIIREEFACDPADGIVTLALSDCDLSAQEALDEGMFLKLVKKMQEKKLLALKSSLEQLVPPSKCLKCPGLDKGLQDSIEALAAAEAQLQGTLPPP